MASYIKCISCGTYNTNEEYCTNCGSPLSYKKRRQLAYAKKQKKQYEDQSVRKENSLSFYEKHKDHRFLIVRVFVKITHSIWLGFMAIGMFIAWLITAIAA